MSKNRKRINKSPIVVTRETDLTGTSNSPIRANGKGGGRFDGSIFIPTTPTGGGPTPTPIPTTTTSTTDNGEITTTTTDNGEITTTTTDNGEITTTTTDNGEITTTTTDNGETTTTTTDSGETTTTTTDSGETTTTTTDNGETTTTTTEDVTTTTTTIDYEVLSYLIIAQRQANGYVYTYTSRDENDEFIYSDYDVKCIEETFPTNSYGSLTIGNEFNEDGYLSIGDDELVRFLSGQISGPFNGTIRGVYRDTDLRLGNTFDKYIITIDTGEVTSIVSFDSIGSIEDCVTPTTTTTTTVLPQLNEIEGSNRFELNNSEIQTEYQNITDSAYSFQEAKNLGSTIITEVNDLITYSHNQENEWSGYLDGDVVPMGVTNNTQKVYHYDELEIGSQLYDDSHNEITGSDMLYIHSDIINSNYNEELSEVQQNGGTLSFVGYEDGIVTELFSVIIDFTGRVYPIDLTEMFYNETICFSAKNLAGDDWYFTDEEVKKAWNSETYANNATRIAISDNNEGSLSVGDTSLVKGNVNTDIDDFNDFDGDLKGVYYDIYKRFSEVAELYVITIEGGEVKGIVNFDFNRFSN
jgi:hypothetical protein